VTTALSVEAVSKRYRQIQRTPTLSGAVFDIVRGRKANQFWALRDVSFSCSTGETLGVIGRNGAGKTTMLRLLAGVTAPTEGRVTVRGRIGPLIGIGVGFDQELTGRENVIINAQMLGLSPDDTRARFNDIVEFSELEGFVDTAVKYYSSGMFLRLAFAVLIHVEPKVLLADELLAVGDVAFQAKCMERMRELKERGATIVLVSHNLDTIQRMCDRTIVLSAGRIVFDGSTEEAVGLYHRLLYEDRAENKGGRGSVDDDRFIGGAKIVNLEILNGQGIATAHLGPGEPWSLVLDVEFDHPVSNPVVGIALSHSAHGLLYATYTGPGDYVGEHGPGRPLHVEVALANPLLSGTFMVRAAVRDAAGQYILGTSLPTPLAVSSTRRDVGLIDLAASYKVGGRAVSISENSQLRSGLRAPGER
jgi:ABC-type polysaccharide/polyol phosphate transport system ATPase subunit